MKKPKGLPIKGLVLFIIVIGLLGGLVTYLVKLEKNIIDDKRKKQKKENDKKETVFKQFLLKNAIIAGSIAFVIGLNTRDIVQSLSDTIINPLFSVDLDHDGNHDFTEITNLFNLKILGSEFKFGQFILKFIHYMFFIAVVYVIVIFLYMKSDFIEL